MAPRSLDAIIKELDASYEPTRQLINQRLSALPQQSEAEISGLKAQEQDYFDNTIMAGARGRGLGFSGIPEGERARYGATQFLPAVARVRQAQTERQTSLAEALNGVNRDQRTQASGIYQQELDRAEQQRQFNEAQRAQREAAARSSAGAFSPSFGGIPTGAAAPAGPTTPTASGLPKPLDDRDGRNQQDAFNDVNTRIQSGADNNALKSDYLATASSAKNGNVRDLYKLRLYRSLRPDLFKFAYSWEDALLRNVQRGVGNVSMGTTF